ncbi:MAG: hypothetical protein QN131_06615 [Armatimonadota bacterium]|nr:hypothetical protein [Armatimonadota bacterium]MDR7549594.1 hypothetical protein [Armatimonadota bacterium]
MKRALRIVAAAVAAVLLIAASPLFVPADGHTQVRVAGGDDADGG